VYQSSNAVSRAAFRHQLRECDVNRLEIAVQYAHKVNHDVVVSDEAI
jgi:hypothetical protein